MSILRSTIFLFLVFLSLSAHLDDNTYLKVKVQPGDGVYSLLRRYSLDANSCNHSKFYEINDLKNGAQLKVGQTYSLPIMIYDFNGKTIRSSVGIKDWNTAKAIENYNDNMLADGYRQTSFKKDKLLWVPYHLLNCPDSDIPEKEDITAEKADGGTTLANAPAKGRRFPIFGKKYEHTPLKNNSLNGKVFYIVSGHGGPDPGAVAKKGRHRLCEDEYAYDVALRLVRNLIAHGATAYMIVRDPNDGIRDDEYLKCDSDEVVWGNYKIPFQHKPRLYQRSDAVNTLFEKHKKQGVAEQKLIAIHVDSRNKREQIDLFFYHHPDDPNGKKLANAMQKSMKANYKKHRKGRGYKGSVSSRDLHMLRETKMTSAYVEIGNILHSTDQKRIIVPRNRQLLADWLFEGIR